MRRFAPPHKFNFLFIAVISSFSLPSISSAADYQIEDFPALADWTIASSDGFSKKKLQTKIGWDGDEFLPYTSGFEITSDTLVYADSTGIFSGASSQRTPYFFHGSKDGQQLAYNINNSTFRVIDETPMNPSAPATLATIIRLEKASTMSVFGSENSSLEVRGHGLRLAQIGLKSMLDVDVGNVWFQLDAEEKEPSYLLQISGSGKSGSGTVNINASENIVFLLNGAFTGEVGYVVQNTGNLILDAKNIYFGIKNTNALADENANKLLVLEGYQEKIGNERTELIAFENGRVGIQIYKTDEFVFKTKKLQIIGDGHKNSEAINIGGDVAALMDFQVGEAYFSNVATGITLENWATAKMQFDQLWNMASSYSLDLNHADLELIVNTNGYFDKQVKADDGYLTINGGNYFVNDSIYLKNDSRLSGTAKVLQTKQIVAENRSLVSLPSTSVIVGTEEENLDYALSISSGATVNLNTDKSLDTTVQIGNDVQISDRGVLNANFTNANSYFIGTIRNPNESADSQKVSMSFENGAFWRATSANSQAVDLSLNNANIYLNQTTDGQTKELAQDNTVELTLAKLSGENGVFHMSTSVEGAYGDSIRIEEGSGKHQLLLTSSGAEPTEDALNRALVTETNGSMELSLANEGGQVDLGNYVYDLATRQTDSGTEWYLSDNSSNPEPDPDPTPDPDPKPDPTPTPEPQPELSPSATAVLALAGSGSQTTQFLYSLSDLRKRMGDIRYGAADGLYASIRGGKDRVSGFASTSYKNEYGALSIGYDRKIDENWILGFSFEAIEGEQTVKSNGYRADGEDSTQSLKAYATWFNSIGCYADFVIGLNRFEQDISTHMLDGTKVKGDFNSYGYGVSAEVGKKFALGSDKTWFIEPQAQLAYYRVQGKDFSLSNGMSISQDNADSLTGRLGVVAGRTLLEPDGTGYQVSLKAGVNHEFLGDADIHVNEEKFTDDSLGTRAYYGLGADWYLSDNVRLYGHIEREKGARFTSEINAKVGVKYHF